MIKSASLSHTKKKKNTQQNHQTDTLRYLVKEMFPFKESSTLIKTVVFDPILNQKNRFLLPTYLSSFTVQFHETDITI